MSRYTSGKRTEAALHGLHQTVYLVQDSSGQVCGRRIYQSLSSVTGTGQA